MMKLTVGQKVLVTRLSLQYSDYKNLAGNVAAVDGDYVRVSIPVKKIFKEDLEELRKSGTRVFVRVKRNLIV